MFFGGVAYVENVDIVKFKNNICIGNQAVVGGVLYSN